MGFECDTTLFMKTVHYRQLLRVLLITLFIGMRFSVGVHAAEYGNGSHDHDGKTCVVTLVSEDEVDELVLLPSANIYTPRPRGVVYQNVRFANVMGIAKTPSRARSPPTL